MHIFGISGNTVTLKGNYHEKFLLQNIFGFRIYITNICVKLSNETVIIKNNFVDKSILCYKQLQTRLNF